MPGPDAELGLTKFERPFNHDAGGGTKSQQKCEDLVQPRGLESIRGLSESDNNAESESCRTSPTNLALATAGSKSGFWKRILAPVDGFARHDSSGHGETKRAMQSRHLMMIGQYCRH
jgi:hypothetical protein